VREGMCKLAAVAGLELRKMVQLAVVVEPMMTPTKRDATVGLIAAAERARHEMRRIDWPLAADEA
jgi:hypothetical protein